MEPCPLITELYSLALREEQLIRRGVRATYLTGLRLRIITTYLQLIRTPEHNPEITRFENQLPIPVLHTAIPRERKRGATEFCLSCRNYLTVALGQRSYKFPAGCLARWWCSYKFQAVLLLRGNVVARSRLVVGTVVV